MEFQATSLNMTELLVVSLAVIALLFILRRRYDSNLPLLFYGVAVMFTNVSDREVNPLLLYAGLIFCLLLRFEFLNTGFSRIIAFFASGTTGLIIWVFLAQVFGDGSSPF